MPRSVEAMRMIADMVGTPYRLSKAMGKSKGYVSSMLSRGDKGNLTCETLSEAGAVVGMKLCLTRVPPKDAIIIGNDGR